ncbi:uncharacterized protein LOC110734517 isoform X2 [Chenopodium quinoa]|uniref:uncharacterized protein LOC110734517 isoform X2 n=1 Tax=Chenopodium quinoa TaxID=63459 RepID=UPI000B782058|nr:uncharacterized protein LOC110734517 isoform X2 [Chenopodium quinoa]
MRDDLPPDDTPWLVLGDLNEVMFPNEKMGGCSFCQSQANDLRMLVDAACLVDLGFNGNPYTWHNAREGCANIRERLDRALANPIWLNTFLNTQHAELGHLPKGYFKVNTDGSWLATDNAGAGGIIRCDKGKWQLGFTTKIKTLGAELIAIREGLALAWDRQIKFAIPMLKPCVICLRTQKHTWTISLQ